MDKQKKEKLNQSGYTTGSAGTFLGLTSEEEAYLDIRKEMSELVRSERKKKGWTQIHLARRIGSSQSRVAKLETGDPGTSMDLTLKALLHLGVSRKELGEVLIGKQGYVPRPA